MNILFLRGFSNYFNRTVKKYSSLNDYKANADSFLEYTSINFNPNDGVITELIIGNPTQVEQSDYPLNFDDNGTPDYAVCYEMEGNPSAAVIKFRWFVLESERTRSGQYRLALKRDVVAEYFDKIKEAPCFIEKGMIDTLDNPLLYNNESMTYNQIKTNEYLLKDSTNSGWIVGYVAKNAPNASKTASTTILLEGDIPNAYDEDDLPFALSTTTYNYAPVEEAELFVPTLGLKSREYRYSPDYAWATYYKGYYRYSFVDDSFQLINQDTVINGGSELVSFGSNQTSLLTNYRAAGGLPTVLNNTLKYSPDSNSLPRYYMYDPTSEWITGIGDPVPNHVYLSSTLQTKMFNAIKALGVSAYTNGNIDNYNNIVVYGNDNKYYKLSITKNFIGYRIAGLYAGSNYFTYTGTGSIEYDNVYSQRTDCNDVVYQIMNTYNSGVSVGVMGNNSTGTYFLTIPQYQYTITKQLLETETVNLTIAAYNASTPARCPTYDASFDIFAIPYGEISFKDADDSPLYTTSKTESLAMARGIATAFGDSCYDLQLVPYCPSYTIRAFYEEDYTYIPLYELDNLMWQTFNKTVSGNSSVAGFVLWCPSSKDTFDINLVLNPSSAIEANPALAHKISNETQLCRLASPNFNGMFEFSLAKNDGITKINVDYTYKPYMPYIHLNPDFKGIYGTDWNDARGLICGGDFSLSYINDAWINYQNSNKYFQQSFDRQIQNMDVNNSIALEKQQFNAITGAITGTLGAGIGGAIAGAKAGPYGAIAGAAVGLVGGAAANVVGAVKDREWLEKQQQETRNYSIDMYGYQLGNIQAMPYSLSKSESLTNNNKIWPVLEVYNATETEQAALWNKIRYNGMTIMAVGNINDYSTTSDFDKAFVRGQLIRLDTLGDDFHIADAIYQEINKGIYIPQ